MNIFSFIAENSLAFLRHNKKTNIIIVLSLTASLLPLYIAFANIQYFISSLDLIRIIEPENTFIAYTPDAAEAAVVFDKYRSFDSLKQYAKTDFVFDDKLRVC